MKANPGKCPLLLHVSTKLSFEGPSKYMKETSKVEL